jgi:hypothetical protein
MAWGTICRHAGGGVFAQSIIRVAERATTPSKIATGMRSMAVPAGRPTSDVGRLELFLASSNLHGSQATGQSIFYPRISPCSADAPPPGTHGFD